MSTVKLEVFLNDVMPEVPGCDLPIALHAIRSAAIEFCERSLVVRTNLDQSTLTIGERYVDLDSPATGQLVAKVLSVRVDGVKVDPASEAQLDNWNPDWRTESGRVSFYTQQDPYQLILALVPDAEYTIDITVASAPKADATAVERVLYDKFREAVAAGAKYRLKAMPSKPWTDSAGAGYYKGRFDVEISAAALIASKGFGRAPLRVATSV